jgi:hypothetical protein
MDEIDPGYEVETIDEGLPGYETETMDTDLPGSETISYEDFAPATGLAPMNHDEHELMDDYLEESDFTITNDEMMEFSYDELQYDGAMDVYDMGDFESYDFGDFTPADMDFGDFDMPMDFD